MRERADHADVALPAAGALNEGGVADDLPVSEGEQGEVLLEVQLLRPLMEDGAVGVAVLDEEAVGLRHGEVELLKRGLVVKLQRADEALHFVSEGVPDGKLFEGEVDHEMGVDVVGNFSSRRARVPGRGTPGAALNVQRLRDALNSALPG